MAIPCDFRKVRGIPTPACRLARNDRMIVAFQFLLGAPKIGVCAILGQQRVVIALLNDISLIQYVDVIRTCHIGKAVGDQDHSFSFCQRVDFLHNIIFALHIDIGGGFIKDVHRTVVEQRSC